MLTPSDLAVVRSLDPWLQGRALRFIAAAQADGVPWHFTSGYRSPADQARVCADIAAGRLPAAPCAPPGASVHQLRLAFDGAPAWPGAGALAASLGLEWGGDWQHADPYHFQRPGTFAALQAVQLIRTATVGGALALAAGVVIWTRRR